MNFVKKLSLTMAVLLSTACGGASDTPPIDGGSNPPPPPPSASKLIPYQGCDDLLADFKVSALARMEATMDAYATPYCYDSVSDSDGDVTTASMEGDSADNSVEAGSATSFTGTNLQESGVDEADIVKTDGTYIYVATSGGVDIFKAWPATAFTRVTTYAVSDGVADLFLSGHRLVVLSNVVEETEETFGGGWCGTTYPSFATSTQVNIVDVSDPVHPVSESVMTIDGHYQSARLVNGQLHFAVTAAMDPLWSEYPGYDWTLRQASCEGDAAATAEIAAAVAAAKEANRTAIDNATIDDFLPQMNSGSGDTTVSCNSFAKEEDVISGNLTGLISLPIDDATNVHVSFVSGSSHEVYASAEAFYLASTDWDEGESTLLHRFTIGGESGNVYFGSASVSGHIGNSFSMSEYENTFRIATTNGNVSRDGDSGSSSNVYILDLSDDAMPVLGSVEDIGTDETIYAVRFIGTRGYLVTFKKIDPLFVLDLTDPAEPFIAGELEMPGYSTYLHPLDDGHLIGLGKDAEDQGSFAWFQGLKLAVFDVSDASSPQIDDDLIIGSRGSTSEALEEHHAFTFDDETGLLALPLTLYTGSTGGSNYGDFSYNGVHVYRMTADESIETVAEIELPSDQYEAPQRTLFVGDDDTSLLYVLDDGHLYQYDVGNDYAHRATGLLENPLSTGYDYWW